MNRWPAVLLVPALIAAAVLVDQSRDSSTNAAASGSAEASAELTRTMPVASGGDALDSTWYCAAGTAEDKGAANQTVIVYNPTDRPTSGTITAIPSKGEPRTVKQDVAPRSQVRVAITDLVNAPYASTVAEFKGGEVVVEHLSRGPDGVDVGPCATSASDVWHFASGSTTLDASEVIVLFNPFPAAATVDIAFALDQGRRRTPGALQGLQVPPRSVVAAPVSVRLEPQLSATVVARSGQVVAERIQTFSGATDKESALADFHPKGLAVTLGMPRPALTTMFPFGTKGPGLHERFVIYNPGGQEAEVELAFSLVDPTVNGEVDPLTVTVNPRSWEIVDMDSEDRVPEVFHAVVVTARNRVPVVTERVLFSADPLETKDVAITPGAPLVADRWIFAAGGNVPGQLGEWLAVANPGSTAVQVQLGAVIDGQVRALPEGSTFALPAHGNTRVSLPKDLTAEQVTMQVFADHPVAAERVLLRPAGARTSTSVGVPSGDSEVQLTPSTAAG